MNILFLTISTVRPAHEHSISLDLLHTLRDMGHSIYLVGAVEKHMNQDTYLSREAGMQVLRVKTGNNKKANLITKGLTMQGIYGRHLDNWHQMSYMVQGGLDVSPVITHRFHYTDFQKGFDAMNSGRSGKVVLDWSKKKED